MCINKVDQAGIGQGLLGTEDALDTGNGDEALARAREAVLRAKSSFEERGVAVFLASAALALGVEELQALLKGKTSVFAGPLGVGKTSLLKRIWPGLEAKTFVISNVTGKSRHSTTFSSLIESMAGMLPTYRGSAQWDSGTWRRRQSSRSSRTYRRMWQDAASGTAPTCTNQVAP